jgi:hypothetical protein
MEKSWDENTFWIYFLMRVLYAFRHFLCTMSWQECDQNNCFARFFLIELPSIIFRNNQFKSSFYKYNVNRDCAIWLPAYVYLAWEKWVIYHFFPLNRLIIKRSSCAQRKKQTTWGHAYLAACLFFRQGEKKVIYASVTITWEKRDMYTRSHYNFLFILSFRFIAIAFIYSFVLFFDSKRH